MTDGPADSSPCPRAALVTGAGKRLGRAIALALAEAGYAVAVHYGDSAAEAEKVVTEITATGGRAAALGADLASEDEVARLIGRAAEALGPLDVLVNNASVFERDEALDVTRAGWDRHMEINLRAPFVLAQGLARQLPGGCAGNIVNILDQRVENLTPHFISYTLSKSGLWTLTRTLALALAPDIRVNAIGPGPVLPSPRQSQAQFDAQARSTPLGRAVAPAEIAAAVVFLLAAPSVTGQMIAVDGGQHLNWSPVAPGTLADE